MNRGDVLDLVQEWRALQRTKQRWGASEDGKEMSLPTQTIRTLMDIGSRMAKALEEIARR